MNDPIRLGTVDDSRLTEKKSPISFDEEMVFQIFYKN